MFLLHWRRWRVSWAQRCVGNCVQWDRAWAALHAAGLCASLQQQRQRQTDGAENTGANERGEPLNAWQREGESARGNHIRVFGQRWVRAACSLPLWRAAVARSAGSCVTRRRTGWRGARVCGEQTEEELLIHQRQHSDVDVALSAGIALIIVILLLVYVFWDQITASDVCLSYMCLQHKVCSLSIQSNNIQIYACWMITIMTSIFV